MPPLKELDWGLNALMQVAVKVAFHRVSLEFDMCGKNWGWMPLKLFTRHGKWGGAIRKAFDGARLRGEGSRREL